MKSIMRLKFKPKPVVGVARRNKDQENDEIAIGKETSGESKIIAPNANETNSKTPCNNVVNQEVADKIDKPVGLVSREEPTNVPQETASAPSTVCEKSEIVSKSQGSNIDDTNSEAVMPPRTCSVNKSSVSCTPINRPSVIMNLTKVESSSSSDVSCVNNSSENLQECTSAFQDKNSDVPCERTDDRTEEKINSNSIKSNSENSVPSSCNKGDKNESKSNIVKAKAPLLARFGKSRFKPVLSTSARKKDDGANKTDGQLSDKPVSDSTVISRIDASNVETTSPSPITVSSTNEDICKRVEEPNPVNPETPIEKEITILESSKPVDEQVPEVVSEPTEDIGKTIDSEPVSVEEPDLDKLERSPVKQFTPARKRHRTQGQYAQLNSEAMKKLKGQIKNGNVDKSKLIMRDLIVYNPTTNPMPLRPSNKKLKTDDSKHEEEGDSVIDETLKEQSVDDVDASRDSEMDSMPVPQLKIGPDGKIVLDSNSLVIETTGTQKSRTDLENSEVVQENEFSSYTKFHKRKVRRNDWSPEETLLFYKALNDLGADFSLMQSLFPKRTRRDLKLKFKKEERVNLQLIDKAMTNYGNFDFAALEKELTKDREERTRKLEEQARLKEEKKKERLEKKLIKKRQPQPRKSAALKEFNEEDTGEFRTQRKRGSKIIDDTVPKKKRVFKKKNDENNDDKFRGKLYDFNLDYSTDENPFIDDDSDDEHDMRYSQIFAPTRCGRTPKTKIGKAVEPLQPKGIVRRSTKNKKGKAKKEKKLVVKEKPHVNKDSSARDEQNRLEEYETGYLLFEEPLDLSRKHGSAELDGPFTIEDQSVGIQTISDSALSKIMEDRFCAETILSISSRRPQHRISESVQIVEELADDLGKSMGYSSVVSRVIDAGDVPDSDQFILPDHGDSELEERAVQDRSDVIYKIERVEDDGTLVPLMPSSGAVQIANANPIEILNFKPFSSNLIIEPVKLLNGDQFTYVFKEAGASDPDASAISHYMAGDSGHGDDGDGEEEPVGSSTIHCYPSSDHNYSSRPGQMPQPNCRTFFVLQPNESVEIYKNPSGSSC